MVTSLDRQAERPSVAELRALPPTISVERAGQIIGVGRGPAYAGVRDGSIPSVRIGRRIVVPTPALLRMLGVDA